MASPKSGKPGISIWKRLFDLAVTIPALILLSPLLILTGLLVALTLGFPIFFRQKRAGFLGRPFMVLKFRTMNHARDSSGNLLPDSQRLNWFGRLLRSTSLDELPELYNVLKGEMSLVGPRPLLIDYLHRYSPEQARRLEVRPGITGWAQIKGRNVLSWEERFQLDVWYVDHRSLGLDLKILFATLFIVLRQEGISADGHATMPEFRGSGSSRE
ncbi:MAG TPA: sugar transferase [Terriglobia bacterium]|nr:sugar transferase [Terriglobia bacterium]